MTHNRIAGSPCKAVRIMGRWKGEQVWYPEHHKVSTYSLYKAKKALERLPEKAWTKPVKARSKDSFQELNALYSHLSAQLGQDLGLHWKDLKTLAVRSKNEGIQFFTTTLPSLGKAILQAFASGVFVRPSGFSRRNPRSVLPSFLGGLLSKVFDDGGRVRGDADSEAVLSLMSILMMFYKAEMPYSESKEQSVIDNFVATEREIAGYSFESDPLLDKCARLAARVFKDFDPRTLEPKHGPGTTANSSLFDKYERRLDAAVPTSVLGTYHFWNSEDGMTRLDRYPVLSTSLLFSSGNTAEVVLVPKDSRGPRLISREPCENQWMQQGVKSFIEQSLASHDLTRGQVNFTDQTVNQRLAVESSLSGMFATIDLKDASDRVTMALVDKIFEQVPLLLVALKAVRSEKTLLPDGRTIKLAKHAPMGSATCFPVLSTTCYLLCVMALVTIGMPLSEAAKRVYVFGDDLIVPSAFANVIIAVLHHYGLRVNTDKSFVANYGFRESCGADAFRGRIVTPIRVKKCTFTDGQLRKCLRSTKPEALVSLVKTAHLMQGSSRYRCAEAMYTFAERFLGPLPYGSSVSGFLCRLAGENDSPSFLNRAHRGSFLRWSKNPNLPEPGWLLKVWVVKTMDRMQQSTPYGHLMRTHPMWGNLEGEIPELGVFDVPRKYTLIRKNVTEAFAYSQKTDFRLPAQDRRFYRRTSVSDVPAICSVSYRVSVIYPKGVERSSELAPYAVYDNTPLQASVLKYPK